MGSFIIRATKRMNGNSATIILDPKMRIVIIPMDDPIRSSRNLSRSKFENMLHKLKLREDGKGQVTADLACWLDRKTNGFQITDARTIQLSLDKNLGQEEFLAALTEVIEEICKRLNNGFKKYEIYISDTRGRFLHSSACTILDNEEVIKTRVAPKKRPAM